MSWPWCRREREDDGTLAELWQVRAAVWEHLPGMKVVWMTNIHLDRYTVGQAEYSERTRRFTRLRFSRNYWPHLDVDGRREMILHEVAHALLPVHAAHDEEWQKLHRSLGGSGVEKPSIVSYDTLNRVLLSL